MLDWSKPGAKYAELALSHGQLMGFKKDSYPVISRKAHPQQWRDWYAYYGFRKLFASQDIMREKEEKTVPTYSPFDFDAEFNPSRPSPEVPRNNAPFKPDAEMLERHRRLFPHLAGNFRQAAE